MLPDDVYDSLFDVFDYLEPSRPKRLAGLTKLSEKVHDNEVASPVNTTQLLDSKARLPESLFKELLTLLPRDIKAIVQIATSPGFIDHLIEEFRLTKDEDEREDVEVVTAEFWKKRFAKLIQDYKKRNTYRYYVGSNAYNLSIKLKDVDHLQWFEDGLPGEDGVDMLGNPPTFNKSVMEVIAQFRPASNSTTNFELAEVAKELKENKRSKFTEYLFLHVGIPIVDDEGRPIANAELSTKCQPSKFLWPSLKSEKEFTGLLKEALIPTDDTQRLAKVLAGQAPPPAPSEVIKTIILHFEKFNTSRMMESINENIKIDAKLFQGPVLLPKKGLFLDAVPGLQGILHSGNCTLRLIYPVFINMSGIY